MDELFEYQKIHTNIIINILNNNNRCIDASDTGTGKTYTSIAICKELNLIPYIVCPKSVISNWINIIDLFKIKIYNIYNYEKLIKNDFIVKEDEYFNWNINIDYSKYLFIYDEAHKCKNEDTINSKLLYNLSQLDTKILLLSATFIDKIEQFDFFSKILNIKKSILNNLNYKSNKLNCIHNIIFPKYGHRMKIDDMKDIFKKNILDMNEIDIKEYYLIDEIYNDLINSLKSNKKNFKYIQELREKIELLKINKIVELTKENINNGLSVVIFVNFTKTLQTLCKLLNTNCIIYGQQTLETRTNNINDFNYDKSRIIICNIKSGGSGISLHDIHSKHQRISLISPTWSAQDMVQVLGRIHRAMAKTDAIQKILFCKNTYEEDISQILQQKINTILIINNGNNNSNIGKILIKDIETYEDKINKNINNYSYEELYNNINKIQNKINEYEKILKSNINNDKINETKYLIKKNKKELEIYENKLNNLFI